MLLFPYFNKKSRGENLNPSVCVITSSLIKTNKNQTNPPPQPTQTNKTHLQKTHKNPTNKKTLAAALYMF